MNATKTPSRTSGQRAFEDVVTKAYRDTAAKFLRWSTDDEFKKYVVPPATKPKPGFAIFYTPPVYMPPLLIVGLNPSDFSDSKSLVAKPNGLMLSGTIPTCNSYLDHKHDFAKKLGQLFAGHEALLASAVGMNFWHFQCKAEDEPNKAPHPLRKHCADTTEALILAMKPRTILCFSSLAFERLCGRRTPNSVPGTRSRWVDVGETRIWYVYHPTGSRTRIVSAHDTPIVLREIAAYLMRQSLKRRRGKLRI
jgi:hypothetical protein